MHRYLYEKLFLKSLAIRTLWLGQFSFSDLFSLWNKPRTYSHDQSLRALSQLADYASERFLPDALPPPHPCPPAWLTVKLQCSLCQSASCLALHTARIGALYSMTSPRTKQSSLSGCRLDARSDFCPPSLPRVSLTMFLNLGPVPSTSLVWSLDGWRSASTRSVGRMHGSAVS